MQMFRSIPWVTGKNEHRGTGRKLTSLLLEAPDRRRIDLRRAAQNPAECTHETRTRDENLLLPVQFRVYIGALQSYMQNANAAE
jgi:hypothetical protein